MRCPPSQRGFTLLETIVASAIIAAAVVALAHLVAVGAAQSRKNHNALPALAAAQGKLRELQSATWTYTFDAPELAVSPTRSLFEDVDGYLEYLDDHGGVVAPSARGSAAYVRRWSIRPLNSMETDTRVVQVCIFAAATIERQPDACVSSILTKRP